MAGIETFLDVGQVAEMLGLSVAAIRRWVLIGYIPYRKIGREVRFSAAEVQEWALDKMVSPAMHSGHEGVSNGGK